MSDAVPAGNRREGAGAPSVVVVAGSSMAPGLRPGWQLRVVPLDGMLAAGDVVVLRSGTQLRGSPPGARHGGDAGARESAGMVLAAGGAPSLEPGADVDFATPAFVVHRVVWLAGAGDQCVVFHRGDAGGRVGMTRADAVVGRVDGVLAAPVAAASAHVAAERTVPSLDALDAAQRRAFLRAQRRCRVYMALRRAAACAGLARARGQTPASRLAALARRLLLRA